MDNPVLVEITRGPLVESLHRGAVAVVGPDGGLVLAIGDVTRPVFARSAIKVVQALPLVESGAAARLGFGAAEIALACGSHVGGPRHVAVARGMRDRLGLTDSCLVCGPAEPLGTRAARALSAAGEAPTALHHMCSGKHLGFLAAAGAHDAPLNGYADPDHPVQRAVRGAVADLADVDAEAIPAGTDGCAVPTFALSLGRLAHLFARLATRDRLSGSRADAVATIFEACWREPELVSGLGRADTLVMAALPGRVYLKTGAEGVYCGMLPELGFGFALKIDDGAARASAAAVMPLIEACLPEARGLVRRCVLRTSGGQEVGAIRTAADYEARLTGLTPGVALASRRAG